MTRILVAGLGSMGPGHALAHHCLPSVGVVGLAIRSSAGPREEPVSCPLLAALKEGTGTGSGPVIIATSRLLAIAEGIELARHMSGAFRFLAFCLAADGSFRAGRPVWFEEIST